MDEPLHTALCSATFSYVETKPVDDELVCSVCHEPLLDPVVEPSCRQMFCRACLGGWLAQSASCPHCRQDASIAAVVLPPRFITNTLDALVVVCPLCRKHFQRKDLHHHLPGCPLLDDVGFKHSRRAINAKPSCSQSWKRMLKGKVSHLPVRMFRLEGCKPFFSPVGESFALDSAGNIYATIYRNSVAWIAIYSSTTGKLLRTVGPLGGPLEDYGADSRGVAVAADGTIFAVSDTGILVFSAQGTLIRTLKAHPRYGICLDGQGNLYAACGGSGGGVRNLNQSGHPKRVVCVPGVTVAVDQAGNIYTAGDLGVTVYDAQGGKQRSFGSYDHGGELEGHLTDPTSIAIDSKGNIAVADTKQGRVQEFDPQGNVIMVLGWVARDKKPTAVPGLFARPTAVAFDADDNLYVLDDGHRMQVFSPDVLSGLL